MNGQPDLGPIPASDSKFRARMRAHQAWYRAEILREPYGTGPTKGSSTEWGNMLNADAAAAGRNFLTQEIAEVVEQRIAQGPGMEPFRCRHNMLSSQPMCANLFGPLVADTALAAQLLDCLLPGEVAQVHEVAIEWEPRPRGEYLGDRTAFDAFVDYERTDGRRALLGIETKLTEPFSAKSYGFTDTYRSLTAAAESPWRSDRQERLPNRRWNQLWRNHMLVEAVRRHPGQPYEHGRLVVVHHPMDRGIDKALAGYRECLRDQSSLMVWPLDEIIDSWLSASELADSHRAWLEAFKVRYLDLARSEEAWKSLRAT